MSAKEYRITFVVVADVEKPQLEKMAVSATALLRAKTEKEIAEAKQCWLSWRLVGVVEE